MSRKGTSGIPPAAHAHALTWTCQLPGARGGKAGRARAPSCAAHPSNASRAPRCISFSLTSLRRVHRHVGACQPKLERDDGRVAGPSARPYSRRMVATHGLALARCARKHGWRGRSIVRSMRRSGCCASTCASSGIEAWHLLQPATSAADAVEKSRSQQKAARRSRPADAAPPRVRCALPRSKGCAAAAASTAAARQLHLQQRKQVAQHRHSQRRRSVRTVRAAAGNTHNSAAGTPSREPNDESSSPANSWLLAARRPLPHTPLRLHRRHPHPRVRRRQVLRWQAAHTVALELGAGAARERRKRPDVALPQRCGHRCQLLLLGLGLHAAAATRRGVRVRAERA